MREGGSKGGVRRYTHIFTLAAHMQRKTHTRVLILFSKLHTFCRLPLTRAHTHFTLIHASVFFSLLVVHRCTKGSECLTVRFVCAQRSEVRVCTPG